MAKLSKDELVAKIRAHFGDAPSDKDLEIIEDISDSVTVCADDNAIRAAKEEVEKKWRKKYADRFLGKKPEEEEEEEDEEEEETSEEKIRVTDLFKEKEEK